MSLQTVTLQDAEAGSRAEVLVEFGFNCFRFQTDHGQGPIEHLWSAPGFEEGNLRASHSGIPILFPFPGRIQGTNFTYEGKQYELEEGDGRGNAIHGFVLNRPWQIVEQSETHVVGRFQASQVDAKLLDRWPADFTLTVSYQLQGNTLRSVLTIENPDDKPLPWGLGTHPYFRVPLTPDGVATSTQVTVPAQQRWELVDMIPSGKRLPADGRYNLCDSMAFPDTQFDDVFTGLDFEAEICRTEISDFSTGRRLTMSFDEGFRECVVYNPPHREAICIEPYTCVPGVFGQALSGNSPQGMDAGVQTLQPGESVTTHIDLAVQ